MGFIIPVILVAAIIFSAGLAAPAAGTDTHMPPQRQLSEGVFPTAVQCNEPRQLYQRDSQDMLCLYESTYEALLQRGANLAVAADSDIFHAVTIGMLAPVTGGAAGYGQDISEAFMLALDDFNAHLEEEGEAWKMEASLHDTQTRDETVMEKIMELNGGGVRIVAGPSIDTFGIDVMEYADDNGMLLFSCCSETSSKRIEGDSLFRMIPDQSVRADILADFIAEAGIKVIVPASRDNEWTSGTVSLTTESFTESNGQAKDPVEYGADGTFDDSHVQALADSVHEALASNDAAEVAVLYIGFEETYDFVEAASTHDVLGQVRWFGADANTILHDNEAGLAFAEQVGFTVIEPAFHDSMTADRVADHISGIEGRQPSVYATFAYDVVQITGRAMQEARTSNPADVAEEIARVSAGYTGASGEDIEFDSAGDRTHTKYAFFEIMDGKWAGVPSYAAESTSEGTLDLTEEETAWLEANKVRFTYDPAWAPIEYRDGDGNVAGLTRAYVEEFERLTGADFEQVDVEDWDGVLSAMADGDADVVFMIVDTETRRAEMNLDFTTPHTTVSTDIVSIGESQHTAEDLAGIRPVTIRDYAIETWLDENHPDVGYVSVGSFEEGLRMLRAGQADVFLDRYETVAYHSGGLDDLYNAGPTGHAYDLSIGYSNDDQILGSVLQKAQDATSDDIAVP